MTNFRYFADLPSGETLVSKKADYDMGVNKKPRIYTETHGWIRATRVIEMKALPTRHECDSRCYNATGRIMKCECSCGGKNHGKGAFNCIAA